MSKKCKVCDHRRQVQNLVETRNVAGLQLLAGGSDHLAKEARLGLHILRTKGIDAPTPPPGRPFEPIIIWPDPAEEASLMMGVMSAFARNRKRRAR